MARNNGTARIREARISRQGMLGRAGAVGAGVIGLGLFGQVGATRAAPMLDSATVHLSKTMRKLWEEHIAWTRLYIVSFAAGLPDLEATAGRLLQNQVDIGNAVKPFYGDAAGNQLAVFLKAHILGAVAVLKAAKAGETAALNQATAAWYANATQIAAFLHGANPQNWALPAMESMMHRHLDLTTQEAVARLHSDFTADIAAYDRVEQEILGMADMLTAGIIAQFPGRFPM